MTHLANLKRARLSDDASATTNPPHGPRQQRTAINSEVGGGGWVGLWRGITVAGDM